VYRGPSHLAQSASETSLRVAQLSYDLQVAASAGGTFTTVGFFSTAYNSWASYAVIYKEFRLLSLSVHFQPSNRYGKSVTNCRPGYVVVDRINATVLGGRAVAASNESARLVTLEDPWTFTVRMSGAEESQYQATTGVTALQWIKPYFDGLTNFAEYGYMHQVALVEFRGTQ
jgi:hypothetical protein